MVLCELVTYEANKGEVATTRIVAWEGLSRTKDYRTSISIERYTHVETLEIEKQLWGTYEHIAGLDEVGVGALAGPIVAAAVILPHDVLLPGVKDSKKIKKGGHAVLSQLIARRALAVSVGFASPQEIDQYNTLIASQMAMKRAVQQLDIKPDFLLVDGDDTHKLNCQIPEKAIVKGDSTSLSIAAASIVAKAVRDELMTLFGLIHPEYQFDRNAGYGTSAHRGVLERVGVSPIHRKSFKPMKDMPY